MPNFIFKKPKMQKRVEFFLILIFLTQKYANEERKKGKWENIKKQTQSVLRRNYYFFYHSI